MLGGTRNTEKTKNEPIGRPGYRTMHVNSEVVSVLLDTAIPNVGQEQKAVSAQPGPELGGIRTGCQPQHTPDPSASLSVCPRAE